MYIVHAQSMYTLSADGPITQKCSVGQYNKVLSGARALQLKDAGDPDCPLVGPQTILVNVILIIVTSLVFHLNHHHCCVQCGQ